MHMNKRNRDLYMDIASRCALMSRAVRLKVGAIIVKDDRIISMSWNGTPTGWDNNCETEDWNLEDNPSTEITPEWPYKGPYIDTSGNTITRLYKLKTKPEVLHAESNCVSKLAKSSESGNGSTMFVTHSPCIECAKLIYQSGINHVFYIQNYRDDSGINFLQKSGVTVEQIK